jgi:hypothetical protein
MDNAFVNKPRQPASPAVTAKTKTIKQPLCLDMAYSSKAVEQQIIKREYVPHVPYKRKRGEEKANDKEKKVPKRTPSKKAMGCGGENKLIVSQQVQEAACTV